MRVFWTTIRQPATPQQVDKVLAEIPQQKPFQGNDYFDHIGWGESVYAPVTTSSCAPTATPSPRTWRRCGASREALAEQGLYLNAHVEMETAIDAFLDVYEDVNKDAADQGPALGRSRTSTRSPTRRSSA